MRLLIAEFITGGGLRNSELPASLYREGDLMVQALCRDFAGCGKIEHIDVLRDARLPAIECERCRSLPVDGDFMEFFASACAQVDAVLAVAPETGGTLQEMSEQVLAGGQELLGCSPTAIALTASKYRTLKALASVGIPTVPVCAVGQAAHVAPERWVSKPDDGVGGEGCRLYDELPSHLPENHILQPYIDGIAASLTLLCSGGGARLMAVNEQYIELDRDACRLRGVHVNGLRERYDNLRSLACEVAAAIPELWGWVGVDVTLTDGGPLVLEINPRPTTAYAGLRESWDRNPAEWLLALAERSELPELSGREPKPVEVMLA